MVEMKLKTSFEGKVLYVEIVTSEELIPEDATIHGVEEVRKHIDVFLKIKKEDGYTVVINPPKEIYDQYLETAKKNGKDTIVGGHITFSEAFITNVG